MPLAKVSFCASQQRENFQAILLEFNDAGDTVIATGRNRATCVATKAPLYAQFAHFFGLRGGKVTGFQQYTDTAQVAKAMRG